MIEPSTSWWGSCSSSSRSWNVPGSLSSPLTTRYFCMGPWGTKLHFRPVAKPAPPRPRTPTFLVRTFSYCERSTRGGGAAASLIALHLGQVDRPRHPVLAGRLGRTAAELLEQ